MRNRFVVLSLTLGIAATGCISHSIGRIQPGSDVTLPLTTSAAAKAIALNALVCAAAARDSGGSPKMIVGESCAVRVDSSRIVTRRRPQQAP